MHLIKLVESYSDNHGIAEDLDELLMHESHVSCPEETDGSWTLLLNS